MKAQIITLCTLMAALVAEARVLVETEPMVQEAGHFAKYGPFYIGIAAIIALAIAARLAYPYLRARKESDDFHLFI